MTEKQLLQKAKKLIGRKITSLISQDEEIFFDKGNLNKGKIGQLIENYFDLPNNSSKKADFKDIGLDLELKVTPMKKLKNGNFSSKERLILNIINWIEDREIDFFKSKLFKKNKKILLIFYVHAENQENSEFIAAGIWEPFKTNGKYANQIKQDYDVILKKINNNNAHNISGSDTEVLEACTKGATAEKSKRPQKDGPMAKQRAFAFKNKLMTKVFNDYYENVYKK